MVPEEEVIVNFLQYSNRWERDLKELAGLRKAMEMHNPLHVWNDSAERYENFDAHR